MSLVANWGATRERMKLTMDPMARTDNGRAQLVYLFQRADRSSFHVGVNVGSFGDEGFGSMRKSDTLLFGKAVLNLNVGH